MAIFKRNEAPASQKPSQRPVSTSRGASADGAISIIGVGMSVLGDISTEGIVRVEGQVRGTIKAGKAVILGHAGVIYGNVYTDDAVIGGTVNGSIVAANRLELQSTCTVEGEIRTRAEHLKLEEGARFAGQVHMIEADSPSSDLQEDQSGAEPVPAGLFTPAVSSNSWSADADSSADESTEVPEIEVTLEEQGDSDDGQNQQGRRKKA